jgi:tetratricopeptide (TPR) repeat protein
MIRRSLCYLAVVIFLAAPAYADTLTRAFLDGVNSYNSANYATAITEFSKIAAAGVSNGKLFYNLGNAYLKNGDLGHAILWYERALKLMPTDPDLKFNHEYALTQVKDEMEDSRGPIFKVLFFWKHLLSVPTVQWTALIFNVMFWLILALQAVGRKNILRLPSYAILVVTLVFTFTALYNHYAFKFQKPAVILSDKVSVRSGLTEDSTQLFVLHAGTKIKIDKENRDFYRIYFSDGKIGWLRKSEIGVI